ncbi:hypothetical protein VHEMI09071 [[Torrubiella] hemipterigena]|uniref:NAD binding Rossmann fold oxidoreductase n=1 Tax=[Torrubiella] hemipterigena TaxID=1531966 RepID=A0A0A1TPM7_9HYPO|nr:hypothetical protein VHEMI09071 [[Torrubiella] hemipterigena]
MASKTFNVGVVGYGLSAKVFHIPFIALTPQFKLAAIVQRTPKPGHSSLEDHPNAKHYTDYQQLLADAEIDVIVITTPTNGHFEFTKAALEAGKHVLTEKPFVPTSAEADKLAEIARANNRLICVYQNRRWDSDFLTVKHLIANNTLGEILEFNTHFDRPAPFGKDTWRGDVGVSGGGSVLYDLGTHLIDQAYVLFGMPSSVFGRIYSVKAGNTDLEFPDTVVGELVYPDGKLVNIRVCFQSVETTQRRYWVRGSNGSFTKDGVDPQEDQIIAGMAPTAVGFGEDEPSSMHLVVRDENGLPKKADVPDLEPATYMAFYKAFGDAIESGKEEGIPVKANEASDVLRVIEAMIESAKTGKIVNI